LRFGKKTLRLVRPGEGSPYPKASLLLRAGARLTDLTVAFTCYVAMGPAGKVLALLYLLFADGMLAGQSPGKKLFGVRVVYLPTRQPARHRDSVLRNAPLGLVVILSMVPELGLKAMVAGGALITALEVLQTLRDKDGLRFGDIWAQTQVTDGKIPLEQQDLITDEQAEAARAPARP
jgi:uncharacterized RDD family membrane protein YckC